MKQIIIQVMKVGPASDKMKASWHGDENIFSKQLSGALLGRGVENVEAVHWNEELGAVLHDRLAGKTHGDWQRWNAAIEALPGARDDSDRLHELLMGLHPWRKGPLTLGSVEIDTEWRSDWKWQRILPHISPLKDRVVLDVGCGIGSPALYLNEKFGCSVVGISTSHKGVDLANARSHEKKQNSRVRFLVADGTDNLFPDDQFDLAWLMVNLTEIYNVGFVTFIEDQGHSSFV